MQNAKFTPMARRAALAIINSTVNPAMRHDAANVTAPHLAEIIERETAVSEMYEALHMALVYIEDALDSEVFKKGAVKKDAALVRALLARIDNAGGEHA